MFYSCTCSCVVLWVARSTLLMMCLASVGAWFCALVISCLVEHTLDQHRAGCKEGTQNMQQAVPTRPRVLAQPELCFVKSEEV